MMEERKFDRATLQDMRKQYQSLLEHPAWCKLMAVVQGQVDELQQILLMPLKAPEEVYMREFNKGQLEGRLSLTNTLQTLIETIEFDLERTEDERRDD